MTIIIKIIESVYYFLWGDWIRLPLPGGSTLALPLLAVLLVPAGIFFTLRTRFVQLRLLPDMVRSLTEKDGGAKKEKGELSGLQALIASTAARVGMGNLVGVVAAISAGGAGALFWMWLTALLGAATAFVEATLAQLHKQRDPLYGGWRGGPAYYIHDWVNARRRGRPRKSVLAVLFAVSGLICWCGISQVISNSVTASFQNAFHIPPIWTTVVLVALAAVIVLRKNATVKVLDVLVPVMAGIYLLLTLVLIAFNFRQLGSVFGRIFAEAFGLRQVVAGGFGAVLMNGIKRGLFSNEAGSGSAPCAAATAETDHPAKVGLTQAMGVFIDTILCTCTALIMLLAPAELVDGLEGMALLQMAMQWHLGSFGSVFIAVILWLFSFTTFIGILFYARSNVAYLFGHRQAGVLGGIAATVGMVTPPMIILSALTYCYAMFKDNIWIAKMLTGVRSAVVPIILVAALKLREGAFPTKACYAIAIVACILNAFLNVNCVLVILLAVAAGLIMGNWKEAEA